MGNKSSTVLANLHEAIASDRVSITSIHGDETIQYLDEMLEFAESISPSGEDLGGEISKMTSKDIKLLTSLTTLLAGEVGKEAAQLSSPTVVKACRVKALATLYWLLRIPQISKGALESCLRSFTSCMDFADVDLAVIVLSCIFIGIKSTDDDIARAGVCFEMGKCGMYGKLINLLDAARLPRASDGCLFLFTLAAEHLTWCLNRDSLTLPTSTAANFSTLQQRVLRVILNRRDALFDLVRHPNNQVSYSATLLLIQVFLSQDKKICHLLQEEARGHGALLWAFHRLAHQSLEVSISTHSHTTPSQTLPVVLAQCTQATARVFYNRNLRPAPVEGIIMSPTAAEAATATLRLEATRLLLTMLCLGDKINETVVLRALPDSFSAFLSFKPTYNPSLNMNPDSDDAEAVGGAAADGSGKERGGQGNINQNSSSSASAFSSAHFAGGSRSFGGVGVGRGRTFSSPFLDGSSSGAGKKEKMTNNNSNNSSQRLRSYSSTTTAATAAAAGGAGGESGDTDDHSRNLSSSPVPAGTTGTLMPSPGCAAARLLAGGGAAARAAFAKKIGSTERGSWHLLTAVICEQLENPRMVWNVETLLCLVVALNEAAAQLDTSRARAQSDRSKSFAWDPLTLDVQYPMYSERKLLCVRGVFLPYLMQELMQEGRTDYLDDPHGTMWAVLDRAVTEMHRVVSVDGYRTSRYTDCTSRYVGGGGVIRDDGNISAEGEAAAADDCTNKEAAAAAVGGEISVELEEDVNAMLTCIQTMLLMLERYHQELYRVTPLHSLCEILDKGIVSIFQQQQRRQHGHDHITPTTPTTGAASSSSSDSDTAGEAITMMDHPSSSISSDNGDNSSNGNVDGGDKVAPGGGTDKEEEVEVNKDTTYVDIAVAAASSGCAGGFHRCPLASSVGHASNIPCHLLRKWVSLTLDILQCRLSGPVMRADWNDFENAGGLDSLCIILSSGMFASALNSSRNQEQRTTSSSKSPLSGLHGDNYGVSGKDLPSVAISMGATEDHVDGGINASIGGAEEADNPDVDSVLVQSPAAAVSTSITSNPKSAGRTKSASTTNAYGDNDDGNGNRPPRQSSSSSIITELPVNWEGSLSEPDDEDEQGEEDEGEEEFEGFGGSTESAAEDDDNISSELPYNTGNRHPYFAGQSVPPEKPIHTTHDSTHDASRTDTPGDLLLQAGQLLQYLVQASGRFALAFASPEGLDLLARALWLSSPMGRPSSSSSINKPSSPMGRPSSSSSTNEPASPVYTERSASSSSLSSSLAAFNTMVAVTQRVLDVSKGLAEDPITITAASSSSEGGSASSDAATAGGVDGSGLERAKLLRAKRLLLVWILLASGIHPINTATTGTGTGDKEAIRDAEATCEASGCLTVSVAKLISDIVATLEWSCEPSYSYDATDMYGPQYSRRNSTVVGVDPSIVPSAPASPTTMTMGVSRTESFSSSSTVLPVRVGVLTGASASASSIGADGDLLSSGGCGSSAGKNDHSNRDPAAGWESKNKNKPEASASQHTPHQELHSALLRLMPKQLWRLCRNLNSYDFVAIFNSNIATSEVIWDSKLRSVCLRNILNDLKSWQEGLLTSHCHYVPLGGGRRESGSPRSGSLSGSGVSYDSLGKSSKSFVYSYSGQNNNDYDHRRRFDVDDPVFAAIQRDSQQNGRPTPTQTTSSSSSSSTGYRYPLYKVSSVESQGSSDDITVVEFPARFSILSSEPQITGIYLRAFLFAAPSHFHVALDANGFGTALQCAIARHSVNLTRQESNDAGITTTNNINDGGTDTGTDPYISWIASSPPVTLQLYTLCVAKLLQHWSLHLDIWQSLLAPQLSIAVTQMTAHLDRLYHNSANDHSALVAISQAYAAACGALIALASSLRSDLLFEKQTHTGSGKGNDSNKDTDTATAFTITSPRGVPVPNSRRFSSPSTSGFHSIGGGVNLMLQLTLGPINSLLQRCLQTATILKQGEEGRDNVIKNGIVKEEEQEPDNAPQPHQHAMNTSVALIALLALIIADRADTERRLRRKRAWEAAKRAQEERERAAALSASTQRSSSGRLFSGRISDAPTRMLSTLLRRKPTSSQNQNPPRNHHHQQQQPSSSSYSTTTGTGSMKPRSMSSSSGSGIRTRSTSTGGIMGLGGGLSGKSGDDGGIQSDDDDDEDEDYGDGDEWTGTGSARDNDDQERTRRHRNSVVDRRNGRNDIDSDLFKSRDIEQYLREVEKSGIIGSLVHCCRVNVALRNPHTAICAVTALTLLLSASAEDVIVDNFESSSPIPTSPFPVSPTVPPSAAATASTFTGDKYNTPNSSSSSTTQIFDLLIALGVPTILLETATILLTATDTTVDKGGDSKGDERTENSFTEYATSSTTSSVVTGTMIDFESTVVSSAARSRWTNCSYTSTDRFIRSSSRPSIVVSSSLAGSNRSKGGGGGGGQQCASGDLEQGGRTSSSSSSCMETEIATAYYRIIRDAERFLQSDFIRDFEAKFGVDAAATPGHGHVTNPGHGHVTNPGGGSSVHKKSEDSSSSEAVQSLRGKLARECIELLRLLAIYPGNHKTAPSSAPASAAATAAGATLASTPSGPPLLSPVFPVTLASLSAGSGAGGLGVAAVPGILNRQAGYLLESLLTAPLVFVMMTDVPLFVRILSCQGEVRRPLAIWSYEMREMLKNTLAEENDRTYQLFVDSRQANDKESNKSLDAGGIGGGVKEGGAESYATAPKSAELKPPQYPQIAGECVVDNVYIRMLLMEEHRDDVGARDFARFAEAVQTSVSSGKLVIQHLTATTTTTGVSVSPAQLAQLKSHLAIKEKVFSRLLADHRELGYSDLTLMDSDYMD